MGLAEQGAILAEALAERADPAPRLAGWAESVWVGAGMQVAFAS
jgi:hypothetical protein